MSMIDIVVKLISVTSASCILSIAFHIRGINILISGLGGGLGWLIYSLLAFWWSQELIRYLIAGFVISVYCEIMARVRKSPVTLFLVIGIIPLVPGGSAYHTMEYFVLGKTSLAASTGLHTVGIAAAIAIGVFLASAVIRLIPLMNPKYFFNFYKSKAE